MNPLRWLYLKRKRRALREAEEMLAWVRDQIASGRVVEKQWQQKADKLRAEIYGLESPADIVRRAGIA